MKLTYGKCGAGFKVYADGEHIGNVVFRGRIGLPFGWIHDRGGKRWDYHVYDTRREAGEALLRAMSNAPRITEVDI